VRVDEAELRGRHPQLDAREGDAQVTGERKLEPAADRVPGEDCKGGIGEGLERVDRFGEGMRDELLRALFELLGGDLPDVVAGGEHPVRSRDEDAARPRLGPAQLGERLADRVEDRMVERIALGRVRDRQPHHIRGRLVDQELAVG
jgi:hypothetical protein